VFYACPPHGLPVNLALAALFKDDGLREKVVPVVHVTSSFLEDTANQDPVIKKYLRQEKDLEGFIKAQKAVSPAANAKKEIKGLELQLRDVRKKLEKHRKELEPRLSQEAQDRGRLEAKTAINKMRREITYHRTLENALTQSVLQLTKEKNDLGKSSLNAEYFQDDISRWDLISKKLANEMDLMDADRQSPPRVSHVEDAVVYTPDGNKKEVLMLGGSGMGTLALVLFGFAFWEFHRRKVGSPEQVVHDLGIKLVGTLPDFAYRPRAGWIASSKKTEHYWDSVLTDSVDALRTMMLFTSRMDGMRVVLVTSAVSGEGKTSSSSHLAASLARSGRKTLLVDCDLRNPTAHRLFNLPRGPGFSEVLRGDVEVGQVIQTTQVDGLSMITAGQGDVHAIQALATDKLARIFATLRLEYDFIVVDSSPILPVPDSLLLAQNTDAVIFSILREVSRVPKVYAAYQRLAMLGVRILGAVVNGTRDEIYGGSGYPYVVPQPE
jgi:capsular exopolysaccharide synthesis family protein